MNFNIAQLQCLLLLAIVCQQTMAMFGMDKDEEPEVEHHHVSVPMKIVNHVPVHIPYPVKVMQKPDVKVVKVPVKVPVAVPVKIPVKVPYPIYVKVPYPVKIPSVKYQSYGGGHEEYGGGEY